MENMKNKKGQKSILKIIATAKMTKLGKYITGTIFQRHKFVTTFPVSCIKNELHKVYKQF